VRDIFQALTDAFSGIGLRRDVEQTLVGCTILNHNLGLPIDGEKHRTPRRLQVFDGFCRLPPEVGEGLNVSGNIEHTNGIAPLKVRRAETGHRQECSRNACATLPPATR
jgi:hypothetical protein